MNNPQIVTIDVDNPHNEETHPPRLLLPEMRETLSKGLLYHVDNEIQLSNNVFKRNTKNYNKLINETKKLYQDGVIELSSKDLKLILGL